MKSTSSVAAPRALRTRIRPLLPWLETFLDLSGKEPLLPPELVSGKK